MVRSSVVLMLLGLAACVPAGRPLPVPIPRTGDELPSRDALLEIGRRQAYDANPGAADRAELQEGIELTIEPQDGEYRQSEEQLARGAIVAQLRNNSRQPYPRYALEPGGRSFWVVYRKKDRWLSAFVSDSRNRDLDRFDIPTIIHPPTRAWRQSIAQWQLVGLLNHSRPGGSDAMSVSYTPWTSCLLKGCCSLDPDH